MSKNIHEVISQIEHFEPIDSHWNKLDTLIQELAVLDNPELGLDALLGVLERYPEIDGEGMFWGIVHLLESLSQYENKLIASVIRKPSIMTMMMINRMLNSGYREINDLDLLGLLEKIATNPSNSDSIREEVQGYIEWQKTKRT